MTNRKKIILDIQILKQEIKEIEEALLEYEKDLVIIEYLILTNRLKNFYRNLEIKIQELDKY